MKINWIILALMALLSECLSAAPANDDFASAEELTGEFAVALGDGLGATFELGEPASFSEPSVWYKWKAPADGVATFGALFSSELVSHRVGVYLGDGLSDLVYNGANIHQIDCRVVVPVVKGSLYFICVSNFTTQGHDFQMYIDLDPAPLHVPAYQNGTWTNDDFVDAAVLTGTLARDLGYTVVATREAGDRLSGLRGTLWWKWIAPTSGITSISSSADRVGMYTGNSISELELVGKEVQGLVRTVSMHTVAGNLYYICMGSQSSYVASLSLIHAADSGLSSGSGVGGRFATLNRQILDESSITGVFTAAGVTSVRVVVTGNVNHRVRFDADTKTFKCTLFKVWLGAYPCSALIEVYAYKNGRQVAKIRKTFIVW